MNSKTLVKPLKELSNNGHKFALMRQAFIHIIVVVLLFLVLYPIFLLLIKSVKDPAQELYQPFSLSFPFCWENYSLAWLLVQDYIINTLIIAVIQSLGVLIVCSFASFAFSRYQFRFKKVLFIFILSFMMIPGFLTIIPQFQMVLNVFKLGNTYLGVALPAIAGAVPMGVFLLNTFFGSLPKDLFEAAELDGASKMRQYLTLAVPLSVPILATLGLMQVLGAWNDLLWPRLVLQEEEMHTITVGLAPFTESNYKLTQSFGISFAGYVIVSIPLLIVFFFTSKQFIKGLTSGAFKM